VPEVGQSEQTQRAEVSGLWDTRSIWTMSTRVYDKECPNQGRHGLHLPKKERSSSKVMTKRYVNVGNKGFLQFIKNNLEGVYKYRNRCPNVIWLSQ
jgi:hypothetical protein